MKKLFCFCLALALILSLSVSASGELASAADGDEEAFVYPGSLIVDEYWLSTAAFTGSFKVKSAYLCEASSGRMLYESNSDERLPIASVTKVMTMLLIMEAIDGNALKYDDTVTVSQRAASMGGSQMYLELGEQMSVSDMLKAIAVASANDAAVAMAEHISGSEEGFVNDMNARAVALGCRNTDFKNASGLPEEGGDGYSSAHDIALITAELLKHPGILKYTSIWMDSLRNGAFGLANTNKLIRFYPGANGMKTGFTDAAKYCISGTATRDGMTLIAVVLGGESSDERFACAKGMLDYGFANYRVVTPKETIPETIAVKGGKKRSAAVSYTPPTLLVAKGSGNDLQSSVFMDDSVDAPVKAGDEVGYVMYKCGGEECARAPITVSEDVGKTDFLFLLLQMLKNTFQLGKTE